MVSVMDSRIVVFASVQCSEMVCVVYVHPSRTAADRMSRLISHPGVLVIPGPLVKIWISVGRPLTHL